MGVCESTHTRAMHQACLGICPASVVPQGLTSPLLVLRQDSTPSILLQDEEASLEDQEEQVGRPDGRAWSSQRPQDGGILLLGFPSLNCSIYVSLSQENLS